jgi:hypothetical protein
MQDKQIHQLIRVSHEQKLRSCDPEHYYTHCNEPIPVHLDLFFSESEE